VELLEQYSPSPELKNLPVKLTQWKGAEKVEIITTVDGAFNLLKQQLPVFLWHTFIKREQASTMKSLIDGANSENVVLQV
jgi:hypothetical protein